MLSDLDAKGLSLPLYLINLISQLEHGEEILLIRQCFLLSDSSLKILDEVAKVSQCFLSEVLGRRCVLLDALQVLDCQKGLLSLLINYRCEPIILLLNFLNDFLLDALLLKDRVLHAGTIFKGSLCRLKKFVELIDLIRTGLLEGHTAATAPVKIEIAVIAESHVADLAVGSQNVLIVARAHSDL